MLTLPLLVENVKLKSFVLMLHKRVFSWGFVPGMLLFVPKQAELFVVCCDFCGVNFINSILWASA